MIGTSTEKMDTKQRFLNQFLESDVLPASVRENAKGNLQLLSLPAHKDEYWKYTRPTKIVNSEFSTPQHHDFLDISEFKVPGLDAFRAVLLNGVFRKDLSELDGLPAGVEVVDIKDVAPDSAFVQHLDTLADTSKNIFSAINAVYSTGGIAVRVAKGKVLEKPLHFIHLQTTDNGISQPRFLVIAEENAQLKVIQTFKSTVATRTFTNSVTEIVVQKNANLEWDKIQYENDESLHLNGEFVWQAEQSNFRINTITLNGVWVRNNLNISITGERCETRLTGLYPLSGHQHVDNHTHLNHIAPHCESYELYKGILADNATGVFNGKVHVYQSAQKTNAFQQNANIVLSDDAQVNTKPELEIYADDVRCSHGCTTGQFDDEAIFYLRARGIGERNARNLLLYAFAGEVLENITIHPLRDMVDQLISERFNWEM